MMKALWDDFRGFLKSLVYAGEGFLFAVGSQRNFRIQLVAAGAVLVAGLLFRFDRIEFILLLLTVIVVLLAELFNTALEIAMNLVEAREHPVVRRAKDLAAGAALIAVIGSIAVGVLLFGPKLLLWWKGR